MKLSGAVSLSLVLFAVVLVDADRQKHRRRSEVKERRKSKCKYYCNGQISECDPVTQTQSVTFELKKGVNCPLTRTLKRPCSQDDQAVNVSSVKGCKYDRKSAKWTKCGPGPFSSKTKQMRLKPGQHPSCPPTKTKTVPCRKRKNKSKGKKKKKGKGKACKYMKGAWSDCDASTNTRTRQLTLKKGDDSVCLPKKTITKKCKKTCKYMKGPWSPCNEATNEKTRQLTLKKGDPNICNATETIVKPCGRRDAFTAAKTSPCKFSKGDWSDCNQSTGLKTRIDTLVKGERAECEPTRVMSRKCGMEECKYEIGDWGPCDEETKERTRIKQLLSGDPEKCEPEIRISRPCLKPNGEESCFLGSWGEYGPCQNGVMIKNRPVIAGGVECERKAVKTKPCS